MKFIRLIVIYLLILAMLMVPVTAQAAEVTDSGTFQNITWVLDSTGKLTISGSGDMPYCQMESQVPWLKYQEQITSAVIEDGITSIGPYAFYLCLRLESVSIADGVTEICRGAFYCCRSLKEIVLPDSLEHIGVQAFYICDGLTSIDFGNSLIKIENEAMDMCRSLTSLTLPDTLKKLGSYCFRSCEKLSVIRFLGNAPTFGGGIFSGVGAFPADTAICYYPTNNSTWTQSVMKDYQGNIRWEPCTDDSDIESTEPTDPEATEPKPTEPEVKGVTRVAGADRFQTSFKAADTLKAELGVSKFQNIIVACGTNFPDALAGTYLAAQKSAPILLVKGNNVAELNKYIQNNLASGGTLYLLGDNGVVPDSVGKGISGITIKRLGGATRYDTNLLILQEAGVGDKDIIVCTGLNFADSLSASATGLPILLVKDGLYANQKEFLKSVSGNFIIVGGTNAVNSTVEKQLASYGSVKRLAGNTRYDTSVLVAKEFFSAPKSAVLAYAQNFPDGLSGGPLAYALKAPLILTDNNKPTAAVTYATGLGIKSGYVLGGTGLISDKVAKNIFSMTSGDSILVK